MVLIAICSVISFVVYHRIFNVIYFKFSALFTEIIICIVVGTFMAAGIMMCPYIAIPVILIVLVLLKRKK